MLALLQGLLLLGGAVSQCNSFRVNANAQDEQMTQSTDNVEASVTHPVHILLTRHGVSCANVVSHFGQSSWARQQHIWMKDPLLIDAGEHFCQVARDEVTPKLNELGFERPDAVVSSVLARAIHTAALQYPGSPVFVVPFIRESGLGRDNEYNTTEVQVSNLQKRLGNRDWSVNYQYANVHGFEQGGDWEQFRNFLQNIFLPDLLVRLQKPPGEPIVLAVVSHSNFMNDKAGEVWKSCHQHYDVLDGKPLNNQVLKLSYLFQQITKEGGVNATPTRRLASHGSQTPCTNIFNGVSGRDEHGQRIMLCKGDVGDVCWKQIEHQSGGKFPFTVEDQLRKLEEDKLQLKEKSGCASCLSFGGGKKKLSKSDRDAIASLNADIEKLKQKPCWGGGLPDLWTDLS